MVPTVGALSGRVRYPFMDTSQLTLKLLLDWVSCTFLIEDHQKMLNISNVQEQSSLSAVNNHEMLKDHYLPLLNPFDAASQRESCFTARTSRLAAALRCCHRSRSDASCLISVVKSLKQHSVFNTATCTAYHFTLADSITELQDIYSSVPQVIFVPRI